MTTPTELTAQGIAALKAGDKVLAYGLLTQSLGVNPQNELAWLWLSGVVQDDAERKYCLEQVLDLNPGNEAARRGLLLFPAGLTSKSPLANEVTSQSLVLDLLAHQELDPVPVTSETTPRPQLQPLIFTTASETIPPPVNQPSVSKTASILSIIVSIVAVLVLCSCLGSVFGGTKQPSASTPTRVASTATPVPALPGIGETVHVGTTTWYISDARATLTLTGEYNEARASGMFIVVEAGVTNGGDSAESLLTPDLADADGKVYEATTDYKATMANTGQCTFERLNPGAEKYCTFVYDVPNTGADLTGWRLKATEMAIFGAKQDILLVKTAK